MFAEIVMTNSARLFMMILCIESEESGGWLVSQVQIILYLQCSEEHDERDHAEKNKTKINGFVINLHNNNKHGFLLGRFPDCDTLYTRYRNECQQNPLEIKSPSKYDSHCGIV